MRRTLGLAKEADRSIGSASRLARPQAMVNVELLLGWSEDHRAAVGHLLLQLRRHHRSNGLEREEDREVVREPRVLDRSLELVLGEQQRVVDHHARVECKVEHGLGAVQRGRVLKVNENVATHWTRDVECHWLVACCK